jgi:hypothetical protein
VAILKIQTILFWRYDAASVLSPRVLSKKLGVFIVVVFVSSEPQVERLIAISNVAPFE